MSLFHGQSCPFYWRKHTPERKVVMTFFYISLLNWGVFTLGCGVAVYFQIRYIRARKCAEEASSEASGAALALAELRACVDSEGSYRLLHADLLRRHKQAEKLNLIELNSLALALEMTNSNLVDAKKKEEEAWALLAEATERLGFTLKAYRSMEDENARIARALDQSETHIRNTLDRDVED